MAMTAALPLRPYTPLRMVLTVCGQCFSDDPDREVDYGTDILQGNLVLQDGSVYLRRLLPARPRRGGEPVRRGLPAVGVPPAVARADPRDHPRHAGQRDADPDGLRQRPRPAPDPALLHPAARRHRALQPELPDLLRGVGHERGPIRPAPPHPAHAGRLDRARGRQDRRADALRRRADGAPRDRRDHPGRRGAQGHPRPAQHQRRSGSPRTTGSSTPCTSCAIGSRSTSSSTASTSRRTSSIAARTCAP